MKETEEALRRSKVESRSRLSLGFSDSQTERKEATLCDVKAHNKEIFEKLMRLFCFFGDKGPAAAFILFMSLNRAPSSAFVSHFYAFFFFKSMPLMSSNCNANVKSVENDCLSCLWESVYFQIEVFSASQLHLKDFQIFFSVFCRVFSGLLYVSWMF